MIEIITRPDLYQATCEVCGWSSAVLDSRWTAAGLLARHLTNGNCDGAA